MKIKNYLDKILLIGIAVIFIVIGYFNMKRDDSVELIKQVETKEESSEENTKNEKISEKKERSIFVHISGCIKNEGVYEMKVNSRVTDLVKVAGGLCDEVDLTSINLSKILKDEMRIHILKKNEEKPSNIINDDLSTEPSQRGKLNINKASLEELTTLPGLGKTRAKAIIDYRTKKKFNTIEDIKNISGIGQKSFEKLKEKITVD